MTDIETTTPQSAEPIEAPIADWVFPGLPSTNVDIDPVILNQTVLEAACLARAGLLATGHMIRRMDAVDFKPSEQLYWAPKPDAEARGMCKALDTIAPLSDNTSWVQFVFDTLLRAHEFLADEPPSVSAFGEHSLAVVTLLQERQDHPESWVGQLPLSQ